MVRRTKEDALATRNGIIDAAEQVFLARGVSGSSLHDIAEAAGVTRGAVYWHFKDKGDLFNAMLARVCLPMEEAAESLAPQAQTSVLQTLRSHLLGVLERVANNEQVRRVFEIATQRVEYVAEMSAVRERHLQMREFHVQALARLLQSARERGELRSEASSEELAMGLHALMDGLIHNWILVPGAFDLRATGARAIGVYLVGLGLEASAAAPPAAPPGG